MLQQPVRFIWVKTHISFFTEELWEANMTYVAIAPGNWSGFRYSRPELSIKEIEGRCSCLKGCIIV